MTRRKITRAIAGLLCAAVLAAAGKAAVASDGMNYYHESMGYIQRTSAQIDSDLTTIKQKTNKLKVYYNPYNSANLSNCQTIVTKAKAQGFYVVWNENNDSTTFTTANWPDYNNRVVADALTAKNAGADEFLVGNEMSIHNDGSAMFSDANFPAAIKQVVTNCAANFPGTKGVEEGWWKHDVWASAGLGSLNKIYFTLYEPPYNFANAIASIWSQFGTKAEIGETSTNTTMSGLANDENDWSRHLTRRYALEQQTGINYWYFTFKEPSDNSFGLFQNSTGAAHLVWSYITGLKTFTSTTYVNDNFDNGTTQDFTGGYNVSNRLRVDAFSEATAGSATLTDQVFRGTMNMVSSTGSDSWRAFQPIVRWTDDNNYYFVSMQLNSGWVQVFRVQGGVQTGLAGVNYTFKLGQDYSFEVRVAGSGANTNVKVFLNEDKLIDTVDSGNTSINAGKAGIKNNGIQGDIDNVLITSVEATNTTSIPPTPTGLSATAGNSQVALAWSASSGATSYNVKRSTTSGSGYATISSPTTTSYTNTGLTNGTTYYYVVSAVNVAGESANSTQASATPTAGGALVKINAGGPAASPFVADIDFSGGTTATNWTGAIDTSAVSSPAPQAVYQSERYGAMTYTMPGLTSGTSYTVRLHFCENYFTASGLRKFNVAINGTTVMTNFDIYATTGAIHKANVQQFTAPANGSGQIIVAFTNVTNNALINGIEVNSASGLVINYGSGFTATGLQMNGNAALNGTKLRLTSGVTSQTSSAFYTTKVNVASFTTHFSFQDTSASGDGMTFCLQNNAATTIGGGGQDLGYYPIANSICVKFDLYSNAGEGINSTGLYTNGALPTVPSTDLTGTGIDLHSGHVFNVTVTYNGTTLTVQEQDATTLATATQNYTINIPTTIGASTAYAGFTAATGGVTAIQDILTWTW